MTDCEHKFVYGGARYKVDDNPRPGTGSHYRYYYDWFFCEKCLESRYERLAFLDTTYDKVALNALPRRITE